MRLGVCGRPKHCDRELAPRLRALGHDVPVYVGGFVRSRRFDDVAYAALRRLRRPALRAVSRGEALAMLRDGRLDGLVAADIGSPVGHPGLYNTAERLRLFCRDTGARGAVLTDDGALLWLDPGKAFLRYIEANLVDGCNLNCAYCTHFAALFGTGDIYAPERFRADVGRLAELFSVARLRLLGGEPLLLPDLAEYVRCARRAMPGTALRVVSNGLLVPGLPGATLDALRECGAVLDLSLYPPTAKALGRILERLDRHGVRRSVGAPIAYFNAMLTAHGGHDPARARDACGSNGCRFLRDGKVHKCPPDALSHRYNERLGAGTFPPPAGVDLWADGAADMVAALEGDIPLCRHCSEHPRRMPWRVAGTDPRPADWLLDD